MAMCRFKYRLWHCLSYPQDSETAGLNDTASFAGTFLSGRNADVYFRQAKVKMVSCKADIPCTATIGFVKLLSEA